MSLGSDFDRRDEVYLGSLPGVRILMAAKRKIRYRGSAAVKIFRECRKRARVSGFRSSMELRFSCLLVLLLCAAWSSVLVAQERIALILGNSRYERAPLANPVNDARAVAERLRKLGFRVMVREDIDRSQMFVAIQEFRAGISAGAIAFFYYAGHAVEYDGQNYLIGIDNGRLHNREDVHSEGYNLNNLVEQLRASESRLNILVVDACRDSPLPATNRGQSRGLAPINTGAGTLLAYSTSPGQVAEDGAGAHSPYTSALLEYLGAGDIKILDLFNYVGLRVVENTNSRQVPWISNSPVPNVTLGALTQVPDTPPIIQSVFSGSVQPAAETARAEDGWAPANTRILNFTSGLSIIIRTLPTSRDTAERVATRLGRLEMRVRIEVLERLDEGHGTLYFKPTQVAAAEAVRGAVRGIFTPRLMQGQEGMILILREKGDLE